VPLTVVPAAGQPGRALALKVAGCGVEVTDVRLVGATAAFGTFGGGRLILGFDAGVVMSTGVATAVRGPNTSGAMGVSNASAGDAALTAFAGQQTYDAAILEFDFVPSGTTVSFEYVFGSEEYNEYVNGGYNDVFAFWLNGENVALVPGTALPVSIDNVNGGADDGSPPHIGVPPISNSVYYLDNAIGSATIADPVGTATRFAGCALDGLTVVFTVTATVRANVVNRMRFAIADAGDSVLDSAVFIRAGSLRSACGGTGATTSTDGAAAGPVLAVPNPFRPGSGGVFDSAGITFRPVPAGAEIRVYTLAGVLVRKLSGVAADGSLAWDGRNDAGKDVASGVYQAVVSPSTGAVSRLKVVIIR
jgi:hypothetical protein